MTRTMERPGSIAGLRAEARLRSARQHLADARAALSRPRARGGTRRPVKPEETPTMPETVNVPFGWTPKIGIPGLLDRYYGPTVFPDGGTLTTHGPAEAARLSALAFRGIPTAELIAGQLQKLVIFGQGRTLTVSATPRGSDGQAVSWPDGLVEMWHDAQCKDRVVFPEVITKNATYYSRGIWLFVSLLESGVQKSPHHASSGNPFPVGRPGVMPFIRPLP